jgi:GAF domain-containing protein
MTGERICAEIHRMQDEGVPFDKILSSAVEMLHESSPRFHWTGIYELHDDTLRLGPFVGSPTDHVFIAVGRGVCGTAVAEGRNMNIPDVSKASSYLACSNATKSELVVLIRDSDRIYAQIDIDSHEFNAFDDEAVEQVQEVADCLSQAYRTRSRAR